MKNSVNARKRLTTILLIVLCLISLSIPAAATDITAPEDIRYGIVIECSYSDIEDSNTVDPSIYAENVFLLSIKTTELYAVAEYSEDTQTYVVTDHTAEQDKATRFRCGTDAKLRISGIVPDTYILDQIQTSAGYTLIFGTELDFSSDTPMVNSNKMDTSIDPVTGEVIASLSIQMTKGYEIPNVCMCTKMRLAVIGSILTLVTGVALIVVLIRQRKEKKSEKSQMGG